MWGAAVGSRVEGNDECLPSRTYTSPRLSMLRERNQILKGGVIWGAAAEKTVRDTR